MGKKTVAASAVLFALSAAIVPMSIAHAAPSPNAEPELVRTLSGAARSRSPR